MPEFDEFCSPAYKLETVNAASSRMVNIYPETIEKGPRAGKLRMRGIPGLRTFGTLPDLPLRALLRIDGGNRLFAVGGSTFYEVFADGTFQAYTGNISVNSHPALVSDSTGQQLAIASGGQLYIVAGGNPGTVTPVSFIDGEPVQAGTLDYMDGYFIINKVNSKQIFISNLTPDGGIWDPGDTAFKEGYSDNIARVFCDNEQLWLFGFDTTEIWQNTGALFPFERIPGQLLRIGCSAPFSVAGARGYRFWLWKGVVYASYGVNPERVSDYGVEEAIKTYGDVSDAEGFCQLWGGHVFYFLIFPNRAVWVFDLTAKCWHERAFWHNDWQQYRPRVAAEAFGKHLVGDYASGVIYEMSDTVYTDAGGVALRRMRTCPYITENMKNVRYNQLTVDMDTGVGLQVADTALGRDPQLNMRWSDNRGKNWSYERQSSVGEVGENFTRVIFNQLGSSRIGKTFEFIFTDPCPLSMNTACLKLGQPEQGR